jgi:hypothetical protein
MLGNVVIGKEVIYIYLKILLVQKKKRIWKENGHLFHKVFCFLKISHSMRVTLLLVFRQFITKMEFLKIEKENLEMLQITVFFVFPMNC